MHIDTQTSKRTSTATGPLSHPPTRTAGAVAAHRQGMHGRRNLFRRHGGLRGTPARSFSRTMV
jgi:hypothetical protein